MSLKDALGAAYDVAMRPGMQGAAEAASALFNGNAFVPYGEAQNSKLFQDVPQQETPQHGLPEKAQEMERGGRE